LKLHTPGYLSEILDEEVNISHKFESKIYMLIVDNNLHMSQMQLISMKSKCALSLKKMKAIPSCSDKSPAVQSLTEATEKITMSPKDKSDSRGPSTKSILYRVFTGLGMLNSDFSLLEDDVLQEFKKEKNLQVRVGTGSFSTVTRFYI
jgi:hypothetical protein